MGDFEIKNRNNIFNRYKYPLNCEEKRGTLESGQTSVSINWVLDKGQSRLALTFTLLHTRLSSWIMLSRSTIFLVKDLRGSHCVYMPFGVIQMIHNGRWVLGPIWCYVHNISGSFLAYVSNIHVLLMALDRYLAICRPFRYRILTYRTMLAILSVSWIVPVLVVTIVEIIKWKWSEQTGLSRIMAYSFSYMLLYLPLLVSYFLYSCILCEVHRFRRRTPIYITSKLYKGEQIRLREITSITERIGHSEAYENAHVSMEYIHDHCNTTECNEHTPAVDKDTIQTLDDRAVSMEHVHTYVSAATNDILNVPLSPSTILTDTNSQIVCTNRRIKHKTQPRSCSDSSGNVTFSKRFIELEVDQTQRSAEDETMYRSGSLVCSTQPSRDQTHQSQYISKIINNCPLIFTTKVRQIINSPLNVSGQIKDDPTAACKSSRGRSNVKVNCTVFAIVLVFSLCWLPLSVLTILVETKQTTWSSWSVLLVSWIVELYPCINPVLFLTYQPIKVAVKDFLYPCINPVLFLTYQPIKVAVKDFFRDFCRF
ncbi:hypothetical protein Btru_067255 [Bulinus truncatus]|nr:hypothetical protein Btru_067255 [Bulinus truncatus]